MSTPRHCGFWKSSDGKWWLDLAVHEYHYDEDADEYDHNHGDGEYEDSVTYGPFKTEEEADDYLSNNFSNPGSFGTDDSGRRPPPKKSPNGSPVVSPGSSRYAASNYSTPIDWTSFANSVRGPGKGPAIDIDSIVARKAATKPAPVSSPVSKRQTNTKPRGTYKIYGSHHDPVKGSSPLHTRIKGSVYAPTGQSKFKKGQSATVDIEKDKLKVSDPSTGHTQVWSKKESLKRYVQEVLNEILRQNNVR